MKFLGDMGVSLSTVGALRTAGHDATHLREHGLHKLPDPEIFQKAAQEGRIVLTFDLDFSAIAARGGTALPSVIIFRLSNAAPASVNLRLFRLLAERAADLAAGAIVTVEDAGYRLRRLPLFKNPPPP
jgi:predicted nuclease of predicted toxin-antitoxin system